MATSAYLDDVLSLATGLSESGLGPAILDAAPASGDADTVTIDIRIEAGELRPAIAVQQALQLCVDAAALYLDATEEGRELDPDYAAALLAESPVELLLVDLGFGSFWARVSINPKTKAGRSRLFAIGALTATGLVFTGVLAPVGLTVAGGLALLNQISPDDKPPIQVPLKTIDSGDTRDAQTGVEITIEGGGSAYEIRFNGSPEAVAAFLTWVGKLDSFRALEHSASDSGESDLLRIWLTERLDQGQASAAARKLGVDISRITVI